MSSTKKLVENFQMMLKELEITGPDDRWKAIRQICNTSLKLSEAKMEYEKQKAEYGTYIEFFDTDEAMTDGDRANVKQAIELRKQIHRRLKQIRKSKS